MRHTYAVPAYRHSMHLEACLASLSAQPESDIVVVTSTPFDGMQAAVAAHGARLVVHSPNRGIGHDWNVAYAEATTPLVTIAHQDDVYLPGHAAAMLAAFDRHPDALMAFCDYRETLAAAVRSRNLTLWAKIVQRELAFLGRDAIRARTLKRQLLRFGNPVPCPAVTFNKSRLPDFRFRTDMRTNMDWAAWIDLANKSGRFVYLREALMLHRIHAESETTACIGDGARAREDEDMFFALWPRPIARLLARLYAASYATNA